MYPFKFNTLRILGEGPASKEAELHRAFLLAFTEEVTVAEGPVVAWDDPDAPLSDAEDAFEDPWQDEPFQLFLTL